MTGLEPQVIGFSTPDEQVWLLDLLHNAVVVHELDPKGVEIGAICGIGASDFSPQIPIVVQSGDFEDLNNRGSGVCTAKEEQDGKQQYRE